MELSHGTIAQDADEVENLVRYYYAHTPAHVGMRPLRFKWNIYQRLEDEGVCKLFLAKLHGRLIGFALYVVQEHTHHDNQIVAHCTMIGVQPEHRSKGIGRKLIRYAEDWFKERGITHMVHHHRTIYPVTPLFESLGFKLQELGYVKEL